MRQSFSRLCRFILFFQRQMLPQDIQYIPLDTHPRIIGGRPSPRPFGSALPAFQKNQQKIKTGIGNRLDLRYHDRVEGRKPDGGTAEA